MMKEDKTSLDGLLSEWEQDTESAIAIQQSLLEDERLLGSATSDLQLISHIQSQQHELTQLKLSERLQREHANQLQQLIEEKHVSSEQQMRYLKSQHTIELSQYQQQLEATIAKNLSTIETLIVDKKSLADELETLSNRLESESASSQTKIRRMKEHYESEMKSFKDLTYQKEKVEREKWQKEKTAKIRELTIKGLEPELQSLIQRHQLELQQVKLDYQAKLLAFKQENQLQFANNESQASLLDKGPSGFPFYSGLHAALSPDVLLSKKRKGGKAVVADSVREEDEQTVQVEPENTAPINPQSRYQPFVSSQLLFQPPAIFMQPTNSSLPAIAARQSIKTGTNHSSVIKRKNNTKN